MPTTETKHEAHGGAEGAGESLDARIAQLIAPTVEALGFEVVRVQLSGNRNAHLQVMAEPVSGTTMTVDHCAEISRAISALLDVEDPIDAAYTLEVSSPGIDRPLTRAKDFVRFAGHEARVEMVAPIGGRKRFQGTLLGIENDIIRIDSGGEISGLPLADVRKAKLILTDKLLAEAENMQ